MTRLPTLAALLTLTAAPHLASAQTQDCIATGQLTVDTIDRGTQRVPRDPRGPGDLITISVGIRNITSREVSFTAEFSAPSVQQNFVTGQSWTVQPGQRAYVALANLRRPGLSDEAVRAALRLSCRVPAAGVY